MGHGLCKVFARSLQGLYKVAAKFSSSFCDLDPRGGAKEEILKRRDIEVVNRGSQIPEKWSIVLVLVMEFFRRS